MLAEIYKAVDSRTLGYREAATRAVSSKVAGAPAIIADGNPVGQFGQSQEMDSAMRQYKAASVDHPYAAIRPIACKVAELTLRCGHKAMREAQEPKMRAKGLWSKRCPDFLHKELAEGLELDTEHEFLTLLERPNPWMVQWSLMYCTAFSIQATGRAFWWLNEGGIYYMPAHWVHHKSESRPFSAWEVRPPNSTKAVEVAPEDMVYFAMPDPANPTLTFSPLQSQARAVNTDEQIQKAQLHSMVNSTQPGMVLVAGKLPGVNGNPEQRPHLTPEQRQQLVSAIQLHYRGVMKHGHPIILDGLIDDVYPYSKTPAEIGFMDSSVLTKERIYQGIGTNPIVAGQVEGANRATAYVAQEIMYANVVNPMVTLMSQTMTHFFSPRYSTRGRRFYCWLERAEAFDVDVKDRQMRMGIDGGVVRRDELREYLGLEPVGGKEGEEFIRIGASAGPEGDVPGVETQKPRKPKPATRGKSKR